MTDKKVLWQIGQLNGNYKQFRRGTGVTPRWDYYVDRDPRAATRPNCPGWLYRVGYPPPASSRRRIRTVSTARLRIIFSLDRDYAAHELTFIYDRIGSDVDHIRLDGVRIAVMKGAGEGKLRRFRRRLGALAKGRHVIAITTHGGLGNNHLINHLRLTADVEEAKVVIPFVVIRVIVCYQEGVDAEEHVDIANEDEQPVDLSGWTLHARVGDLRFVFPAGTILQPGGTVRIYTKTRESGGLSFGSDQWIWDITGDTASLYDKDGNLVSNFAFGGDDETQAPGEETKDGIPDVIDTTGALTAALDRLNRRSVINVLEAFANELDEHCQKLGAGTGETIEALRKELREQIENLRLTTTTNSTSISSLQRSINDVKRSLQEGLGEIDTIITERVETRVENETTRLTTEINNKITEKVETRVGTILESERFIALQNQLTELRNELDVLEKASKEVSAEEREMLQQVLTEIMVNMDLSSVIRAVNVTINGREQSLDEVLDRLANRPVVIETSYEHHEGMLSAVIYHFSDDTKVRFIGKRIDQPDIDAVDLEFVAADFDGLMAEFTLRFRRTTRALSFCDKKIGLDDYVVIWQTNVVFDLGEGGSETPEVIIDPTEEETDIDPGGETETNIDTEPEVEPEAEKESETAPEPTAPQAPQPVPLYRLYQPKVYDHFFTTNATEAKRAHQQLGYNREGIACKVFPKRVKGSVPLYRAYHQGLRNHFYTISKAEWDNAVAKLGYKREGIAGYVYPTKHAGAVPLFRVYQPRVKDHHYTTKRHELDNATQNLGYIRPRIACYVIPV